MGESHHKPYCISPELVEGCNRMCSFCGIHGIWTEPKYKKLKFMSHVNAIQIAIDIKRWYGVDKPPRLELAMHGEPTLNPDLIRILSTFRANNPNMQIQLTTNGKTSLKDPILIPMMFQAGLNILLVDTYDDTKPALTALCKASGFPTYNIYDADCPNPFANHRNPKLQIIVTMDDLGQANGKISSRVVWNMAGSVPKKWFTDRGLVLPKMPMPKKCIRPFREMDIHWDGTVPVCCLDWKHECILGKFPEQSLEDIWEGDTFMAARLLLWEKNRTMRPCYKCNYFGGHRIGLIPRPPTTMTTQDALLTMQDAFKRYNRAYTHPNAQDAPFFIKTNKGFAFK